MVLQQGKAEDNGVLRRGDDVKCQLLGVKQPDLKGEGCGLVCQLSLPDGLIVYGRHLQRGHAQKVEFLHKMLIDEDAPKSISAVTTNDMCSECSFTGSVKLE